MSTPRHIDSGATSSCRARASGPFGADILFDVGAACLAHDAVPVGSELFHVGLDTVYPFIGCQEHSRLLSSLGGEMRKTDTFFAGSLFDARGRTQTVGRYEVGLLAQEFAGSLPRYNLFDGGGVGLRRGHTGLVVEVEEATVVDILLDGLLQFAVGSGVIAVYVVFGNEPYAHLLIAHADDGVEVAMQGFVGFYLFHNRACFEVYGGKTSRRKRCVYGC